MSNVDHNKDSARAREDEPVINSRKFWAIIIPLIAIFIIVAWIKFEGTQQVPVAIVQEVKKAISPELQQTRVELNATKIDVNITKQAVINVSENQKTGLANQKVLAKGLNDLGAAVIPELQDIKNNTNLIDDIKFSTDIIANKQTLKNVSLEAAPHSVP